MRRAALLAAAVTASLGACGRGPVEYRMQREAMGTTVLVRAVAAEETTARAAGEAAWEAIAQVERLASTYDPNSELSRLNASAEGGPVSGELYEILALAYAAAAATEGYFDPTVGPLVAAYGVKGGTPRWPDDDELAAIRERVGYEGLLLDEADRTARFAPPGRVVDLGGIAKGWAVDRAVAAMKAAGAEAGLVEAGGEVSCFGGGPRGGERWRLGIQHPDGEGLYGSFELEAGASATSGGYEQRFEAEGRTFSHLFDPHTGRPVEGPAGVTVVAATCAEADAWATALAVMPPAEARRLLKPAGRPAALILRREGEQFKAEVLGKMPKIEVVTASD